MGQDPEQIREEIEQTRLEMGETVGAISYKTDLKSRGKDKVADTKERTRDKVTETKDKLTGKAGEVKDRVTGTVSEAQDQVGDKVSGAQDQIKSKTSGGSGGGSSTPDRQQVKYRARRAKNTAQQNPLGLAVGSIAAGFLAGLLIPTTDIENEKIGPIADQVKEEARSTGQEAIERGKEVVQDLGNVQDKARQAAADAVKGTVSSSVQEQAEAMKDSVRESAENVQDTARSTAKS